MGNKSLGRQTNLWDGEETLGMDKFLGWRKKPLGWKTNSWEGEKIFGMDSKSLGIENKSLGIENKSLEIEKKALRIENKSLGIENKSLGIENKSLGIENKSLGRENKLQLSFPSQVLDPLLPGYSQPWESPAPSVVERGRLGGSFSEQDNPGIPRTFPGHSQPHSVPIPTSAWENPAGIPKGCSGLCPLGRSERERSSPGIGTHPSGIGICHSLAPEPHPWDFLLVYPGGRNAGCRIFQ